MAFGGMNDHNAIYLQDVSCRIDLDHHGRRELI